MKIVKRQLCFGMFLAMMLLVARLGHAQAIYGSLFGTVLDNTGAVVPNAKVTVTDDSKGTKTIVQSNGEGFWRVDNLIPDTYTIQVEAGSFVPGHAQGVDLHAGASQQVDISLQVQGSQQSVTVTSEAPPLKIDRAEVSEVLNQRAIQDLPNLTRNFTAFALLTPGMQHSSFNILGPENPQGGLALNSNGSNYGVQGFLLDGTENRDPVLGIIVINPTLDSIGELKVTTQNYDAEFGGAAGGIISASTRSGSNNFHGDAFWFRHSDAQQARDPFAQALPDPITGRFIPSALYSQFGGRLGGPIIKNKPSSSSIIKVSPETWQPASCSPYRRLRSVILVLPPGSTTCDLSQYVTSGSVYKYPVSGGASERIRSERGPCVRALPPGSQSPPATARSEHQTLPRPRITYAASGNGSNNGDQADVRLDYPVNDKLRTFGRYDYALYRLARRPCLWGYRRSGLRHYQYHRHFARSESKCGAGGRLHRECQPVD